MAIHHILILLFYVLGVQSIQGMKNFNKNLFKLSKKKFPKSRFLVNPQKNNVIPLKNYSNIAQKYFEQIPDIKGMMKNNDPALDNYSPEFFEKLLEAFSSELKENYEKRKQSIESENPSDKKKLIDNLEKEYDSSLKNASIKFGQAEGLLKRHNTHKKSNQTTLQRAKNFITNWRTYLFGKRADKNTQKRTYATRSHKNPGTGYFAKKLGKRSYSSVRTTQYRGPLFKEMTENSFDINAIKKSLEDPKNIIENYKKILGRYILERPALDNMEEFRDDVEYRKEKAAEIIKVINENSDIKSQIDDYNETLKISHDKKVIPLVDKLIATNNIDDPFSIINLFVKALKFEHVPFYNRAATERSKLEIMTARMLLLDKNLQSNLHSIDTQNIDTNPFYRIAKHNYYRYAQTLRYSQKIKVNTFKKNFYNSFDNLTIPIDLNDLSNIIEKKPYVNLADSENVQDLCFFLLYDYLIYNPGCTAEKLTQFYAFLNKMKNDKEYRKNEIDKLIPSQKGDEEGFWKKFGNLF